ncbi:DUF6124 family protein [Pseudomonas fluorescens]|uniref:DUF6124 family protein n=1 Tax=Pseudomonas fluorescens TaxID=294 RepID=UPI0007320B91|nr:DUF6124 family protein [Pseudomonas fluorescens]
MDKLIPDPPPLHQDIAADANAERVIDSYLNPKPAQRDKKPSPDQLFTVVEGIDAERLLANLSETLASANAMASDLAFDLKGSRRHVALGLQQLIELGELLANRALDTVDPR